MSKRKKRLDDPNQLSLFDLIANLQEKAVPAVQLGSLNVQAQFREIVSDSIRASSLSRWEIAGKMSNLLDTEVTKYMLDSWTAESKDGHRFPAEYLPAFCEAVGSHKALQLLAEKAGVFVMPGQEALRAEVQKIEEQIKKLHEQKRKRLTFLGEMEDE